MKILQTLLVAAFATASLIATAADGPTLPGMPPTMTQAMNPLMGDMMNPMGMMANPMATCASCHTAEEVARYQKTFGPMMAMMNPVNWMNPGGYMNMMAPMMDPKTYRQWYNAYMNKMGSMAGDPAK